MTLPGWRLEVHDSLPSTADLCRRRAEAGEPAGLAIMARRQPAGRGSHGRAWADAPGNLFLSALLRPGGGAREAPQWALLAGVALAEALAAYLPDPAVLVLKWPNDLLLAGRKAAGILVESAADTAGGLAWVSLGLGVNLAAAPAVAGRATAALADFAAPPEPEALAGRVLERLGHWNGVRAGTGFAPVRAAFLAHAPAAGTAMTLSLGPRRLAGEFAGLGEDGSLLLRAGGRVHAFAAGEVTIEAGH